VEKQQAKPQIQPSSSLKKKVISCVASMTTFMGGKKLDFVNDPMDLGGNQITWEEAADFLMKSDNRSEREEALVQQLRRQFG
jgi:hypothetical protein